MNSKKNSASSWKLYCIIDKAFTAPDSPKKKARFLFVAYADVIELRYKNMPSLEFMRIAKKIRLEAKKYKKALLINDRVDVALASGSDGVHLGMGDPSVRTARQILGSKSIIGKTVHSVSEAKVAKKEKINYVGAGPIFSTPLKKNLGKRGTGFIGKIKKCVTVPVVAIGGINKKNVKSVLHAGASAICVTRAANEAKTLLKEIKKCH